MGTEITVTVPPLTLQGERADRVFGDRARRAASHVTASESILADTTAGLLLGHFGAFDEHHMQIPDLQLQHLRQEKGIYGNGQERAQVALLSSDQPSRKSRAPLEKRLASLEAVLFELLNDVRPSRSRVPERLQRLAPIVDFAFQAWDNARDHGEVDTDGHMLKSARFLSIRRTATNPVAHRPEIAGSRADAIQDYITTLHRVLSNCGYNNPERCPLLEITVADGGIGVAARMFGSLDIFHSRFEDEQDTFISALRPSGTSKSASDDAGRGGGFPIMLDAAYRFHGLTIFRTGRICASRHFLAPEVTSPIDVWGDNSLAYDVRINDISLPLIGGTSTSLICPLDNQVQRQLSAAFNR